MAYKDPEKARARNVAYYAAHREENSAKCAAYRAAHLEERRAKDRAYRAAHAEEIRAYRVAYRAAHGEELRQRDAAYHAANRVVQLARRAAYYAAHREHASLWNAAYRAAHPEQGAAHTSRRKAAKRGVPINDFTAAQWREMQAAYDHRCAYCDKRAKGHLTQDHITPLSKGGSNTLANIIPACHSCNSSKQAGPVLSPVQPLLLSLAPAKKR